MRFNTIIGLLFISTVLFSCKKDSKTDIKHKEVKEELAVRPKVTEFMSVKTNKGGITTVKNMFASLSDPMVYTKFNLKDKKVVTGENWDIAFFSRAIIVNGGSWTEGQIPYAAVEPHRTGNAWAAMVDCNFDLCKEVPSDAKFKQDAKYKPALGETARDMFQYFDMGGDHLIKVKENYTLIVKTTSGNYAKIKIETIYKNGDGTGTMQEVLGSKYPYYSFSYYYNEKSKDLKLSNK